MTATLSDSRLTNALAEGCGQILKGIRKGGLLRHVSLGDAGDELAQSWISRVLEQHRPDDGFLSEEATDTLDRLNKERVWICLLYTSPSPRDATLSRMPSSA